MPGTNQSINVAARVAGRSPASISALAGMLAASFPLLGGTMIANTAANSISAFRYTRTGHLELLESVAATTSAAPADIDLAGDGRFLYSLDAGSGRISGFRIDRATGELTPAGSQAGLPASSGLQGIAAKDL